MQNISKGLNNVQAYQNARTGTYCDKHSLLVRNTKTCKYTEIIPLDEKLGPYHGPETEIINGRTARYCIQCRKEEKVFSGIRKLQEEAQQSKKDAKKAAEIKRTSAVLKNQSIITDKTIKEATFENFKVVDPGTKRIKEKAGEFVREILADSNNTYVFAGGTGRGKSHISMAILHLVNKESYKETVRGDRKTPLKCVYISIPKLITLINETHNMNWAEKESYKYTDAKMKELIATSDLVVLDDIGAEVGSLNNGQLKATSSQTRLLTELLNSRQGKSTIISTNLSQNEIKSVYDERVHSRINKNVVGLVFDTNDKRGAM